MKSVIIFTMLFVFTTLSYSASDYYHKYYSYYHFKEEKSAILQKIETNEKKLPYLKSFWKVYYNKQGKVMGEEYYKNRRLYYYYLYQYKNKKVHKRGFYWHGITQKAFFHYDRRYIFQGYYFNRTPDVWWIYNIEGNILSKSYYNVLEQDYFGKAIMDYTDKYIYDGNHKLIKIERFRGDKKTMTYTKTE